ncbi:hypothetical protein pb186bvf_006549 [Paramecium bursaria]
MNQQSQSAFTLKIINFQVRGDIVYYNIQVVNTQLKKSWNFEDRYKNMLALHTQLKSIIKAELPQFPGKKLFGNTDEEFITQRKAALHNYFKNLLAFYDPDQYPPLKAFLTRGEEKEVKDQKQSLIETRPIQQKSDQDKQQEAMKQRTQLRKQLNEKCDQVKQTFLTFNQMAQPEENLTKQRRSVYDNIRLDDKSLQLQIPKSNPDAKILVGSQTLDQKAPQLFEILENIHKQLNQILI